VGIGATLAVCACGSQAAGAASTGGCRLSIHYNWSEAATQQLFTSFTVRNRGAAVCRLSKHPRIELLDRGGRRLHYRQNNRTVFTPPGRPLTHIAPGGAGGLMIEFPPLSGGGFPCHQLATRLIAYLGPGARADTSLPVTETRVAIENRQPFTFCSSATFSITRLIRAPRSSPRGGPDRGEAWPMRIVKNHELPRRFFRNRTPGSTIMKNRLGQDRSFMICTPSNGRRRRGAGGGESPAAAGLDLGSALQFGGVRLA
jgi:hypothetical protein